MPQDFDEPTGQEQTQSDEVAATDQFQPPPTDTDGAQAAFVPDAGAQTAGFSTQLLDAHAAVEDALRSRVASAGVRAVSLQAAGNDVANVEGVALGLGAPGDAAPGEHSLNVFVTGPLGKDTVREMVVDGMGVSAAADLPLTVRQSGSFEAQQFNFRMRPAPGGISVGHVRVTAGTLGCLSVGRQAPRNGRLMVLSNNHVLANSNNAAYGDSIIQPGRVDGGTHPADQIAILERFVPIKFGGPTNYVDCATGWAWPDRVRKELLYRTSAGLGLYRIGSNPIYPTVGMTVGKSGRTTELTQGRIVATNWSGSVNYGVGTAFFSGQFVVQTPGGTFSAGGDSGSVIWKWENGLPPVGLLFAGGGGYTIASPMPWVTYFLDINLYT